MATATAGKMGGVLWYIWKLWPINKKQGDSESKNIYKYIWFKFNKYQSLRMGCIDCNMAAIFETDLVLVQFF